ncbi:glycoside hydrolase family 32 protein [Candidatus Poribacteria bacterium]|nr:glycoside hydrolase family 32 protein [Candidatus Poribacteria bacterium]
MIQTAYNETYRPQFHFTPKTNWTNDPNGLIYYKGEYHLFFQHNPTGINWGNMTWGHAVSRDLVHWKQLPHAIHPDELGTIFSGSGVVDWNNTAGFQTGDEAVLVVFYTSAGSHAPEQVPFTQSIAYSNDRGRSWTKYEGNPVIEHIVASNRDPKVVWHEPTQKWVMTLFLDKNDFTFFGSTDLKKWERLSDIEIPDGECPDLFELPIDGDSDNTKWVFWGAGGKYYVGDFDGTTFTPDGESHRADYGANFYAAQTWSDIPDSDGRRIQISWMNGSNPPEMPFNQQMSFPCVLTLRTTSEGIRLHREPVEEIVNIHDYTHAWSNVPLNPDENLLDGLTGELFDIRAEIELNDASAVGFKIRGQDVRYSVEENQLTFLERSGPLAPQDGKIKLQILVDRISIEAFGNSGALSMTSYFLPDLDNADIGIYSEGGSATLASLKIHELKSSWV